VKSLCVLTCFFQVLTTLPRREWATTRNHIVSSSDHNKTALDVIDGALFVLVLDDFEPKDIHEAASNMLHGTYNLRTEDNLIDYQVCGVSQVQASGYRFPHDFISFKGWFMLQPMV
jgi:hypothetical protein